MPWVKLDDGYYRNLKARAAGPLGRSLHLAGSCWSAAALSDGRIPKDMIDVLLADAQVKRAVLDRILEIGLWHDEGDYYLINDWQEYIKSRAEVEKERARWRTAKRHSAADSTAEAIRESPEESSVDSRCPDPTRPLSDLQPPTTESRLTALSGRVGEVLNVLLATERTTSGPVRNRHAWEDAVTARLATEHGERIRRLVDEYPDAPPDVIAGQIVGDSNGLRYYTRRDTA
jgi:hypothetical protein